VRGGEIKAITGLRALAAAWVVLFHFRPLLHDAAPQFSEAFAPVLNCGAQGVDLFFILSGFVLTWNHLDAMGPSWSARAALRFLWLRLARVWPVFLVTLHLAAAWIVFTHHVGHVPSPRVDQLSAVSYLRQMLLVQLWFQPYFDGSSWDGPAWSISAEWLAYLVFGLLILVIFRIARVTRARSLLWLALVASVPPVLLLLASGHFYTPWSWLPRTLAQFTAGALAGAAVRKLRPTDRFRRAAGFVSVLLVGSITALLYTFDAHPVTGVYDSGGLVDVLFVPLVVSLAVGAGALPGILATRVLVFGGQISFSLYMVHELVHTAWNWVVAQFALSISDEAMFVLFGLLAVAIVAAILLYQFVEEPARRWMRRVVDDGDATHVTPADSSVDAAKGKLQPVAGGLEAPTKVIVVRAG
jgi:peptidoglycan/LPS O-acetylase OafA/YrhL